MRDLITVKRGTKGLYVRPRCIGTAWSLPSGAVLDRAATGTKNNGKDVLIDILISISSVHATSHFNARDVRIT
jgi:hypothetical protein